MAGPVDMLCEFPRSLSNRVAHFHEGAPPSYSFFGLGRLSLSFMVTSLVVRPSVPNLEKLRFRSESVPDPPARFGALHIAKNKVWTAAGLSDASGLELEVVLVSLWGEGIDYVDSGPSRIRSPDVSRAQQAVGLSGTRANLVGYWTSQTGLSREELSQELALSGFLLDPRARTVPKGSVRTLTRLAENGNVNPAAAAPRVMEAIQWRQIGSLSTPLHLRLDEVESIHWALERDFAAADDPISPAGVKFPDLLASAIERPQTSFMGEVKYKTLAMCAAALTHSLINNHPFHNGNKRTALVSLLTLLDRNDSVLDSTEEELYRFFLQIAAHGILAPDRDYEQYADREVMEIARWINQRSRSLQRGERSVQWRTLQKILRDLGCEISQHRGDKLRITRTVVVRSGNWFRATKERKLSTYYTNTGDGREVPKIQLKRLRVDLELDEAHNVDSEQFYTLRREPDFFIAEYSRLLHRLARV